MHEAMFDVRSGSRVENRWLIQEVMFGARDEFGESAI